MRNVPDAPEKRGRGTLWHARFICPATPFPLPTRAFRIKKSLNSDLKRFTLQTTTYGSRLWAAQTIDVSAMASFTTAIPMIFRSRLLLLALLGLAAMSARPVPAAAQAASEFAPLPAKPSKPKPARPAIADTPAPVAAPEAAAKATPAVTPPAAPAAASAPAEPAPAAQPAAPAVAAPTPAEPAPAAAATPGSTPAENSENKAQAKPEAKPEEPKAAEKEKDKKKKAAEKHEKQEKNHKQAKEQAKEKDIAEPKPDRVELKNANRLPPDDKGPRAIDFLGGCANNYEQCMAFVNEQAQKIPNGEVCLQNAADQQEITEKVRKFITLRPAIHGQAANRMVTEALYVIYPCRRAPARSAGHKK
jgi:hypothetical protein